MLKVYSKTVCPYCVHVKQFLKSKNISFEDINIELMPEGREFLLSKGHRSVPQIYFDDELFVEGGWQGLNQLTEEEINAKINSLT